VTRTIGMCRGIMLATIIIIFFVGLSAQQLTASVVDHQSLPCELHDVRYAGLQLPLTQEARITLCW
jgi:hypothetical protein